MLIRKQLIDRARDFNIILDDVAITELSFGREYAAAVESKQVHNITVMKIRYFREFCIILMYKMTSMYLLYCLFMFQSFSSFKVAQQEAQRAAFVVDRAIQEKQQKIVQVRLYTCSMIDLQIFFLRKSDQ